MYENFIKIAGKKEGGTSIILTGVHGDEKGGVRALEKIASSLNIESGTVFIIYGNPRALESGVRYTEANLNRMFKDESLLTEKEKESYEYGRAQFLKTFFDKADVLLDIHESSTPNSKPFVICEDNAKEIVKYLPVDTVVSGFDSIEPGGTDFYMNSIGRIGICIECGYLGDSSSADVAEKSIRAFLSARGHAPEYIAAEYKQSFIKMHALYFSNTNRFTLAKDFKDFEEVAKGQIIGTDGEGENKTEISTEEDSIILFAKNRNRAGEEAFLLGAYSSAH